MALEQSSYVWKVETLRGSVGIHGCLGQHRSSSVGGIALSVDCDILALPHAGAQLDYSDERVPWPTYFLQGILFTLASRYPFGLKNLHHRKCCLIKIADQVRLETQLRMILV
jgi:hypothetical protein